MARPRSRNRDELVEQTDPESAAALRELFAPVKPHQEQPAVGPRRRKAPRPVLRDRRQK